MPQQTTKYSAMEDFKRKGITYLFKQPPAVVLAVIFLGIVIFFAAMMWRKIDRTDENCDARIKAVNVEWAMALNRNNESLAHCMAQKDTLFKLYAQVNAEVALLKAQQRATERKRKSGQSFYGVRD